MQLKKKYTISLKKDSFFNTSLLSCIIIFVYLWIAAGTDNETILSAI